MTDIDFTRKLDEYKNKSDEEEILQFLSDFWSIKPDSNGVFTLVAKYQKAKTRLFHTFKLIGWGTASTKGEAARPDECKNSVSRCSESVVIVRREVLVYLKIISC